MQPVRRSHAEYRNLAAGRGGLGRPGQGRAPQARHPGLSPLHQGLQLAAKGRQGQKEMRNRPRFGYSALLVKSERFG